MSNVRWSIVVRDEVDKALRTYLGRHGTKKGDLSQFVEEAVRRASSNLPCGMSSGAIETTH